MCNKSRELGTTNHTNSTNEEQQRLPLAIRVIRAIRGSVLNRQGPEADFYYCRPLKSYRIQSLANHGSAYGDVARTSCSNKKAESFKKPGFWFPYSRPCDVAEHGDGAELLCWMRRITSARARFGSITILQLLDLRRRSGFTDGVAFRTSSR